MKKYLADIPKIINSALDHNKKVIFEGAQGAQLDVDHGVYPFTTSSNTTVGAVLTGAGVGPKKIDKVIGVVKAYLSRVGGGPLPTEQKNAIGDYIRKTGAEYGTTTGRPRRIGWIDLVQLRQAGGINGLTSIAITKIDVLDNLKEIKVCVAYKYKNKILKDMPADLTVYRACKPVYKVFPGWKNGYGDVTKYSQLPKNLRKYVEFIARDLKVPIDMVSIGPEREKTIVM